MVGTGAGGLLNNHHPTHAMPTLFEYHPIVLGGLYGLS
jgi:hypothetical protein